VESRTGESGGPTGARARRSAGRPRRSGGSRGRIATILALVLAALAGLYGVSTLGPVHTVLRQSFTDEAKPSVDFYFNGAPYVSGEWLEVPLGVLNGTQSGGYSVKLWIVDAAGKVQSTATAKLPAAAGRGAVNVNILLRGAGQIVWARLVGTSLTVHDRFEGSPLGTVSPATTPSASASRKG
jgi:hypothetical protein